MGITPASEHLKNMEKRLKHWSSQLDGLAQKALSVEANQKATYDKRVVELRAKLDNAHAKLEELRNGGDKKWDTFKSNLEVAIRDFEKAFKD